MEEVYSKEEWLAFLNELQLDNNQLDELIHSQNEAENFFKDLQSSLSTELATSLDLKLPIGYQIGNYKVKEEIGRGGMALVYKATRADALFDQEVAIKLLSPVLNTKKYEEYFSSERQLLASLNHPNIAKIFDGGVTHDQIPYFIMEYIDGIEVDAYCKNKKFTAHQIIKMVIKVCQAIQHAHNNFILHRDIKPSNVLITNNGEVKLLDFGIGKILDEPNELEVSFGGTLKYASPEQLRRDPLSTQSDIYQIGVLLYELLAATSPFSGEDRAAIVEAIKSGNFKTPKEINPSIGTDLNAIILKCMATKTTERYLSVTAIIDDLNNYLTHLPVSAKHQNWSYTTKLFLQRNMLTSSLVTLVVLISVGAAIITQIQILETKQERIKVSAANAFLTKIFESNDPDFAQGKEITAVELLKNSEIEIENITDPEIKAYTQNQLGELYKKLGLWEEAGPLFFNALENYLANHPEDHLLDIANLYSNVYGQYRDLSEYEKADSVAQLAIDLLQDSKDEYPIALSVAYREHAYISYLRGAYETGEKEAEIAIELIKNAIAANHRESGHARRNEIELAASYLALGSNLRELSKLDEALEVVQLALTISEKYESEDLRTKFLALNDLAMIYSRLGQFEMQTKVLVSKLDETIEIYGIDNPTTISLWINLASAYYKLKNHQKSDSLGQLAYDASLKKFGPYHNYTVSALYNLGTFMIDQKKFLKAREYLRKVLDADMQSFGNQHPYVAGDLVTLGTIEYHLSNYADSEEHYQKAFEIYFQKFGEKHQKISYVHSLFGDLYGAQNNLNKARPHYEKALAIGKEVLGEEHPEYIGYVKDWKKIQDRLK